MSLADSQLTKAQIDALTDADWRERLSEEEYQVLCQGRDGTPVYRHIQHAKDDGVYRCKAYGQNYSPLILIRCGWPSWMLRLMSQQSRRLDTSHCIDALR